MKQTIRYLLALFLIAGGALHAQTTITAANVEDSDGTVWVNAPYTINTVSSIQPVTNPGNNPFTTSFSGTTDGSGHFSATLQRVANMTPSGVTWRFCITPAVTTSSTYCVNVPVGDAGQSTEDVSAQINAVIQPPRLFGGFQTLGYADVEVPAIGGSQYYNVVLNQFRCYTTSWGNCGGTGTGIGSITWNVPSGLLSASPTTINASGTQTFSLVTQSAHIVFAGPASGSAAAPTFRSLVANDIPSLPYQGVLTLTTTGTSGASTLIGNTLNIPQYSGAPSGFPITLGSTSIAASSTTTSVAGLTIDGVSPTTMGYVDATSSIQTQLNGKQGSLTLTTTGSSGASTLIGNTLNIPQYAGGGSMTWPTTIGLANYAGSSAWGLSLPVPPYTVPSTATGVTYFVDSVNGLDTNNGTSTATPWKTIAKVNASTFNPGDQVLFLRGDVWHEQLTVPSSGSSTAQLTFGNYGPSTLDLPIIDPALAITSWSLQSGTTYQHATTIAVYTVYVDSLYQPTKSLAHVASLALVNSTPGSFLSNGSELYVNLPDGTDPTIHTIEIGYLNGRAYGVLMTDKDYVTVTGLKVIRAYVAGIEGNSVTSNQGGTYYNAYNIVTGNTIFNYGNYLHTTGGNTGASAAIGVGGDNLAGENPIPGWQITYNNIGVSDYTQALDYTTAGIQLKNLTGVLVDHNTIATVNSMAIQSRLGTTNTSTGPGTISNNDISNSQGGISAEDSAFTVQANKIHDGYGFGIQATTGSLILNNDIHNLSQSASGSLYNGIDENAMTGVTIAGNKITNIINGCSLDLENGSTGAQVFGNLFDGFGDGCILYIPSTSVTGLALGSNTYVEAPAISTTGFHYGGGSGTQHSRAAFWTLAPEGGGDVSNAFNLQGFAVPAAASGYLHYNGTAYVWDTPSGGPTLQTNGVSNTTQTALNFITSTANVTGLTVTPSNPSTSSEQMEITGNLLLAKLATQAANTVVGNGTGSTAAPTALSMPSCSGASNALTWTSATGFGCNTISGSGTVNSGTAGQLGWYAATGTAMSGDTLLTDSGTVLAYTGTGGMSSTNGFATAGDGTHAGMLSLYPNTTVPTLTSGDFSILGPNSASITAFAWQAPTATNGSAGLLHIGANSGAVSQMTISLVGISDLSATGTPSSTTYLRGDNTWGTPAGSGTTVTVANGTATLGTSSISTASCATVVTVTATGTASTDSIIWNPNASIKAVTGYTPSTSGGLTIAAYPATNAVNFDVCNWTSGSITPGAVTLNWRVVR